MIEKPTLGPVECQGNEQALVETRPMLRQASELSATSELPLLDRLDHKRIVWSDKDSRPPEGVPRRGDQGLTATDAGERAIPVSGQAVTDDPAEDKAENLSSDSPSDQPSPERTPDTGEACAGTDRQEPGIIPAGEDVAAAAREEVTERPAEGGAAREPSPEPPNVVEQADEESTDNGDSSGEAAAVAAALNAEEIDESLPHRPIGKPVAEAATEANQRVTKETDDPRPPPSGVHLNLFRTDAEVEPHGQATLAHGQTPTGSRKEPPPEHSATHQNEPTRTEKTNRIFTESAPVTYSQNRLPISFKDYLSRKASAFRPSETSTLREPDLVPDPKFRGLDPASKQPKEKEFQRALNQKSSVVKPKSQVKPTRPGAPQIDKPVEVTPKDPLTAPVSAPTPAHPPLDRKFATPESTPATNPQHDPSNRTSSGKPTARQPGPTSAWGSGGMAPAVKPDDSEGACKNGTRTLPNGPASRRHRPSRLERELAKASIRRLVEAAITCILVAHGFSPGPLMAMASKLVARALVGRPSAAERILGLMISLGRLLDDIRKLGKIDIMPRYDSPTGPNTQAAVDGCNESPPSISHRDHRLGQESDSIPDSPPSINAGSHQELDTAPENPPSINAGSHVDDTTDRNHPDRRRKGPRI